MSGHRISLASWPLVFLLTASAPEAQLAPPPGPAISSPVGDPDAATYRLGAMRSLHFTKYQLGNGLEVILHHDHSLPLVAVNLWYHVGPVNEPRGRSGFAHLFEHLMFEGSKHVGANFDHYLESVGATNANGTTSWDRTNYFETVPREHLELALWLESDRMGFLRDGITQRRFDAQRDVVMNERRQSYETAPYGPSTLTLLNTLYPEGHPYHGAVIGTPTDLEAATLEDVRDFTESYYAPSNATLCLAGDFEPARARRLIEKYFGSLRRAPRPARMSSAPETPPDAKRVFVDEPVTVAKVTFGFRAPPAYTPSHAPLEVLAVVLAQGRAARLYRHLIVEEPIAIDVDAELDAGALGSIFVLDALASPGTAIETLEARLERELWHIIEQPPTLDELRRAKRYLELRHVQDLELLNGPGGESGRAGLLQHFNHYMGDPGAYAEFQRQLARVTSEELVEVTRRHLTPSSRVTVITRPRPPEEATR